MRILYCNLRPKWAVKGHIYFDAKWVHLLSDLAEVTLLCYENEWYENISDNIHKEVCDVVSKIDKEWVSWKVWSKGQLKRLGIKDHAESNLYIKRVIELSRKNQYDYIIIATLDMISYYIYRKQLRKTGKMVLIVHSIDDLRNGIINKIFVKVKNDFKYIVMEEEGSDYLSEIYDIDKSRIYFIPHMLNPVTSAIDTNIDDYDIVGISNSNDDNEVKKIICLDKYEHFFERNGLRAILRSMNIEYSSTGLKVFRGRLGLSYDEYYTYISKARLILLPFSDHFGLRTSGTIMDAFSQGIPILGNCFKTMEQYSRQVPNICKIYSTMEEFKKYTLQLVERTDKYDEEYQLFQDNHSDIFIIHQMKKLFR